MKQLWWRRGLALALAFVMTATTTPLSVFAAQTGETQEVQEQETLSSVLMQDGWSYTIQEDGTAMICGASDEGQTLEIPSRLGDRMVSAVAEEAFAYNETATAIVVPETVTAIGNSAFYHCENMRAIAFLGDAPAFGFTVAEGCHALEAIFVQESCDISAFCALLANDLGQEVAEAIQVLEYADAAELKSDWADYLAMLEDGGVAMLSATEALASGNCGENLTWELTSDGTLTISGTGAMWDGSDAGDPSWAGYVDITSLIIEDGITYIGEFGFYSLSDVEKVTIPASVTSIGESAFSSCGISEITFLGEAPVIADNAFSGVVAVCYYPAGDGWDSSNMKHYGGMLAWEAVGGFTIEDGVLTAYTGAGGDVVIPDGVIAIGESVFAENKSITSVTFPDSLTDIGAKAFYFCQELESVTFGSGLKTIGESAFQVTEITGELCLPEGLTDIGNFAFHGNDGLSALTLPSTLTNMGNHVFGSCMCLESVTISDGVTAIGDYAFSGCSALSRVDIPESVTSIGEWAFYSCQSLRSLVLPSNLKSIGSKVLGYYSVVNLFLTGNTVPEVQSDTFESYGLETIYVPAGALSAYQVAWGSLLPDGVTIKTASVEGDFVLSNGVLVAYNGAGGDVVIPDGVTAIADAFVGNQSITAVTLPDSVTAIGDNAFNYCFNLKTVTFGTGLKNIGDYAFIGCESLSQLSLPAGLETIGEGAFNSCTGLTGELILPASLTSIGGDAFNYCCNLTGLTVAGTDMEIGMYAFSGCMALTSLDIQDGVAVIGDGAFNGCSVLTKVTIPASVTSIGAYAFGYLKSLTEIYFLGDAPVIGDDAFGDVTATCYYPANNATWTSAEKQNYGGTLTWVAFQDTTGPVIEVISPAASETLHGVATFKVKVSDVSRVESITLYNNTSLLAAIGRYEWSEYATKTVDSASATVEFEVNIPSLNLKTETLYVKLSAVDGSGNTTESGVIKYATFTTPDPPSNLSAVSTQAGIELVWTHSDTSIDMYKICRSMDYGDYEQIDLITKSITTYTDTTVVAGHTYAYQVYAGVYKISDAFSEPATISDVVHVDHVKPTIESISPVNGSTLRGEVEFVVSAADNCGLLSLTLTAGQQNEVLYLSGLESTDSIAIDSTNYEDGELTVTFTVADFNGLSTTATCTYTVDNVPDAPVGLYAVSVDGGISLGWNAPATGNVASYVLERSTSSDSGFAVLATMDADRYWYRDTDTSLVLGEVYYYRVKAVSEVGMEGPYATISIRFVDVVAPTVTLAEISPVVCGGSQMPVVTIAAEDANGITLLEIGRRASGAPGFTSLGRWEFDGSELSRELGAYKWISGQYEIRLRVYDAYENTTDVTLAITVDNDGPTISDLTAELKEGDVALSWNCADFEDVASFEVYRGRGTDNEIEYTRIAEMTEHTEGALADETIAADGTYYYYVVAKDALGNESMTEPVFVTVDNTAPEIVSVIPADMTVIYGTVNFEVAVADNCALESVTMTTSAGGMAGSRISGIEGSEEFVVDTTALPDGDLTVTFVVTDTCGNETEKTCSYTVDNVPDAPTDLTVQAGETALALSWGAPSNPNIQYYVVERSVGAATDFAVYEQVNAGVTTYRDTAVDAGTTYYYRVLAQSGSGMQSEYSNTVECLFADIVAPVITGLSVAPDICGGTLKAAVQVRATDNVGVETIVLTYSADGETFAELTALDGSGEYVWDVSELPSGDYTVAATAYDAAGNVSSRMTDTVTVDNTVPAKIVSVVAIGDVKDIKVNWAIASEVSTLGYRVYRRAAGESEFSLAVQINGRSNLSWTDSAAEEDVTYEYYVVGINRIEQEGEASDIASAMRVKDTEAPVVIALTPDTNTFVSGTVTFAAVAQDNLKVAELYLLWSADEGETWTQLAQGAQTTLSAQVDTKEIPDGVIRIKAYALDTAGNQSSDKIHVYSVDNTGPAAPTGFAYESTTVTVTLRWEESVDEDVAYYRVERRESDGSYIKVTDVYTTLGANITGLEPGSEYTYRVVGYDQQGNRGVATDDLTAMTQNDTNAPVITLLRPTSGWHNDSIDLTVTATDDFNVGAITVQTSANGSDWADVYTQNYTGSATSRTLNWVLDLEGYEEGSLYVRAIARDSAGNTSDTAETAPCVQHMIDRTAPDAPADVTAAGYHGYVEVTWNVGSDNAVTFSVWRCDSETGTFAAVRVDSTNVNYIDYDVEPGQTWWYKVQAKDRAGNVSDWSAVVSATVPVDTTAPVIAGVSPADGQTIGGSYRAVQVSATDDLALGTICLEYSTDGTQYTVLSNITEINAAAKTVTAYIPTSELTHGSTVYVRFTVTDAVGNAAEPVVRAYIVDNAAPTVTSAAASYADNGVAISWVGAGESDLVGYKVYRSANGGGYSLIAQRQAVTGQNEYSCNDYNLALTQTTYTYRVDALDSLGNTFSIYTASVTVPDRSSPNPVLDCEATQEVGVEYVFDATRSSDDSAVVAWEFDFGDGTTSTEAAPIHIYDAVGEYTVTLRVTDDAGNTSTLYKEVTVRERTLLGTLEITVVDQDGNVVPNAPVHFDLGSDDQIIRVTNSAGKVTFTGQVGRHTIGCIIPDNNWLSTITDVVVTAGETTTVTMTMAKETMIEGEFEIHQMTREEIIAVGINPDAPENQYIVEVNVSLTYGAEEVKSRFTYNPGTGVSTAKPVIVDSSDGQPHQLVPVVLVPKEAAEDPDYYFSREASVAYLDIPIGVSALKEFFDVKLHIINNDSADSAMVDNVVHLNVPSGLTLMDTYISQANPTVNIAEIRGQSTHTVEWVIRGDKVGEYYLSADFTGILDQFGWEISTQFVAEEPIVVRGLSDLLLTVEIPEKLDNGTLYYNVSLTNLGRTDINDPKLTVDDDLIEVKLYNDAGIAISIVEEPDVLPGGYCVTKHYMEVDQTDYSDIDFELRDFAYSARDTYGLQIKIEVKPVEYFKKALSPLENSAAKADMTYTSNQGVYDYIMNHNNFVYWSMYKSTGAVEGALTTNFEEGLWDALKLLAGNGGMKDLFGGEDEEFIRAIILDAMELSIEGSEEAAAYVMFCEFLDKAMDVMEDMNLDEMFGNLAESYGACMKETFKIIALEYKWEFYTEGYKGVWGSTDDFVLERCKVTWSDHYIRYGAYEETRMSKFLHQLFSAEGFEAVWEAVGFTANTIQSLQTASETVKQDIGIYLAAQSTLEQCNLFLDALITYSKGVGDRQRVQSAAEEIKEAMSGLDVIGGMIEETLKEEFWVGMDMAKDKILDKLNAKAPKLAIKIKLVLKLTTYVGDNLFNVSERHNIADNIRFVSIMSDCLWYKTTLYHDLYEGYPCDEYARDYMQCLAYLINLRAIGESQVAHFGVSYEVVEGVFDGEDLLVTVRAMSADTQNAASWIEWRDIVEDKLSRARLQLLKNPLAVEVNDQYAPIVTFDYANEQTAQSFSTEYEYSVDRGVTWTTCDGGPIELPLEYYSYQLQVRRVDVTGNDEKRTAVCWISSPWSPDSSIAVYQTADGYKITGLDSDKQYAVTFSDEVLTLGYDSVLDMEIPAGSSNYEHETGAEYKYAYIRSLADSTQYDSWIICRTIVDLVNIRADIQGSGYVSGTGGYEYGKELSLVATPVDGCRFVGWYEGETLVSEEAILNLTAEADRTLTAKFEKIIIMVSIEATAQGSGTVAGGGSYEQGSAVILVATPADGYEFAGWYEGETLISSEATLNLTAEVDRALTAKFEKVIIMVEIEAIAQGSGTVVGAGSYEQGSAVTLVAIPADGYEFVGWYEGETLISSEATLNLTAEVDRALTAKFEKVIIMVEIEAIAQGSGTVVGAGSYEQGSAVILVATPADGYEFAGWYEGETLISSEATLNMTADADRALTASFKKRLPPVEATLEEGAGMVELIFNEEIKEMVQFLLVGYSEAGQMLRYGVYSFEEPTEGTSQLVDVTGWTDCEDIFAFLVNEEYCPLIDYLEVR